MWLCLSDPTDKDYWFQESRANDSNIKPDGARVVAACFFCQRMYANQILVSRAVCAAGLKLIQWDKLISASRLWARPGGNYLQCWHFLSRTMEKVKLCQCILGSIHSSPKALVTLWRWFTPSGSPDIVWVIWQLMRTSAFMVKKEPMAMRLHWHSLQTFLFLFRLSAMHSTWNGMKHSVPLPLFLYTYAETERCLLSIGTLKPVFMSAWKRRAFDEKLCVRFPVTW